MFRLHLGFVSFFIALSCFLFGCGGSAEDTNPFHKGLINKPGSLYGQSCSKNMQEFNADVQASKYIAPVFSVRSWRGTPTKPGEDQMKEKEFIDLLLDGRIDSTLVEARSGLGKTKLIEAITAQTCGRVPVFSFDLKSTILPAIAVTRPGENAILNEIGRLVGMDENASSVKALGKGLHKGPFVLLLDAMDEVALYDREILVKEILAFKALYPGTVKTILLSRPPVYENVFGLGQVDAWIQIPPLQCDRTEERVLGARGSQAPVFWLLAAQVGVDRKVSRAGNCRYAHMSSYRDAHVVLDMAKRGAFKPDQSGEYDEDQITRGYLYEHYARSFVDEIARAFSWTAAEALRIVDRIIAGQNPRPGVRSVSFTVEECASAVGVPDLGVAKNLCKDLVATKLFKRMGETFRFVPRNQSVTDYFLARWLDGKAGTTVKVDCSVLTSLAGIFESSEIVSFLAGMPNAQQCALPIIETLCSQGAGVESTVDLLDQGLPTGKTRTKLFADAKSGLQGDAGRCVEQILAALQPSQQ